MQRDLEFIKAWMQQHAPATLTHLNVPASTADLQSLETAVGQALPESFKQFMRLHNGDSDVIGDTFFGDYNVMLSTTQIVQQYQLDQEIARHIYDPQMATMAFWRDRVSNQIIFVKGAVKPLMLHPKWIPITCMNGDVLRYLDFDPAPGGVLGQVIEVDPESCAYQVIASSFEDLIRRYRIAIETGVYTVNGDGQIASVYDNDVLSWGVPEWLQKA